MLSFCATGSSLSQETIHCESPALPLGSFHVVIAGYAEKTCFTRYLWHMGLTNAQVFVYRRTSPERPLREWQGPCGIVVKERLLLPNYGKEAPAFHSYVLEHYDNPPLSVLLLHGHGPNAYHTDCQSIVGRARLFYQGLGSPSPKDARAEFARHMVTLTRMGEPGDPTWMQDFTAEGLRDRTSRSLGELEGENSEEEVALTSCMTLFDKWSVSYAREKYFYSCCAQFILPWDRILMYPKQFYVEALQFSQMFGYNDRITSRYCWEYVVYSWYKEPALTPSMKDMYLEAGHTAKRFNLTSCSGTELQTEHQLCR